MAFQSKLWVIDDDPALRLILEDTFTEAGLEVRVFANAQGAWASLNDVLHKHESRDVLPDVILTDIRMPMMDGLSFSEWVHENFPDLPIVIMTAHSDLKSAVDSYQTGAFDYLPKPFDLDDAVTIIEKAIQPKAQALANAQQDDHVKDETLENETQIDPVSEQKKTNTVASKTAPSSDSSKSHAKRSKKTPIVSKKSDTTETTQQSSGIIGQSVAMQTVFRAIGRLSKSPITVLITGESGTGKELVAHALHQHSPRQNKPFIALNMAALPHDLIESELFGHEKGAFTGATTQRQGRFEQANGGTLFLDEIGDMPFSTQTRLLRVLANGEFFRVGGVKPIKVDVRIVAATHQNLEALVKQGKFREDLFYRLNVIRLPLPPLRARRDDIPALVDFFMKRAAIELNSEEKVLSSEAMQLMQAFDWSGNVRQLENACRWITVMATGDLVFIDDLPPELTEFAEQYHQAKDHTAYAPQGNDNNVQRFNTNTAQIGTTDTDNFGSLGELDSARHSDYQDHTTEPTGSISSPQRQPQSRPQETNNSQQQVNPAYPNSVASQHSPMADILPAQPLPQARQQTGSETSATYLDALQGQLTWQEQLEAWADEALRRGETDILQRASIESERVLIQVALAHTRGRKGEAAQLLGWGRNTLTRKLKQLADELN